MSDCLSTAEFLAKLDFRFLKSLKGRETFLLSKSMHYKVQVHGHMIFKIRMYVVCKRASDQLIMYVKTYSTFQTSYNWSASTLKLVYEVKKMLFLTEFLYNFSSGSDFAYVLVELMFRSQDNKWNPRFVLRADRIGREYYLLIKMWPGTLILICWNHVSTI